MNLNIFNGLPEYVRITVLAQTRRLLITPLFNYEDKEDIAQDLLLFYLQRFYKVPNPDEALVVHSLKQYATNLIVKRYNRRDFLNSSLADYDAEEEFFLPDDIKPNFDFAIFLRDLKRFGNFKEREVLDRILEGDSIDEISRDIHMSKKTIYQFFEKLRKKAK